MNAKRDLLILIVIMVILWFVWFFTGGPQGERANGGPFLRAPQPLDTGETYGESEFGNTDKNASLSPGISGGAITITSSFGAKEHDPNKEYIEIQARGTNATPLAITGWSFQTSSGKIIPIPGGSELFIQGVANTPTPIVLAPGEKAVLISGRSPVGASFRVNSCSAYLEQLQDFTPPLLRSCPTPLQDLSRQAPHLASDTACLNRISSLPICTAIIQTIPEQLSDECTDYLYHIGYNTCVETHKKDIDFKKSEWRIFLNENTELWKNTNDVIRLYDQNRNLVDTFTY